MPLTQHLTQGQILYFTRNPNAISVSENHYLRWLMFDDIVQSVMNKRQPEKLTLPHHYAVLMPLLNNTPSGITEFGLGGGNIARFIQSLSLNIPYHNIESNIDVIRCFQQFFDTQHPSFSIFHQNALLWINELPPLKSLTDMENHWFIYDIYQHSDAQLSANNKALFSILERMTSTQFLTVNLPFISRYEISKLLRTIKLIQPHHQLSIYQVPHYQNKVIHLLPHADIHKSTHTSPLPPKKIKYWRQYHKLFNIAL